MLCPLNKEISCPLEDVYGACFFCDRVNEKYAVSKIPILETEFVYSEDED